MRTTKYPRTRNKLLGGLGAVGVAVLLTLTGLAPAGADPSSTANCESASASEGAQETPTPKSVWIAWRSLRECGSVDPLIFTYIETPIEGTSAHRYSSTTGEILWERVPGAVNYEIFLDGASLGFHDRLNWYMTDLEASSSYLLSIRAFDQYGTDLDMIGVFFVPAFLQNEPAPAGPSIAGCDVDGTVWILRTFHQCGDVDKVAAIEGTSAARYSGTTGEILWERVPGAVNYEIFRDGVSLGVYDRLNWYMTDLEASSSYRLSIRAFDQDGIDMDMIGSFVVPAHTPSYSGGTYI